MTVHAYQPLPLPSELDPYVRSFHLDRATGALEASRSCRILPDGGGNLLFRIYGDHARILRCVFDDGPPAFDLWTIGPRSVYTDVDLQWRALTVAVAFRPGGAAALLGRALPALTDQGVGLDELLPADRTDRLRERLATAPDVSACLEALRSFLLGLHRRPPPDARAPSGSLSAAAHLVRSTPGGASVQEMAEAAGWSTRHLRSAFREQVGHSPKTFARIVRVRQAVNGLQQADSPTLAQVALQCGYYDQSHMTSDFQALLGESPTTFARRLAE